MITALKDRIFILVAAATVFVGSVQSHAQDIRTLNLDFGNAGAYVGAGGVLSSPGGTHWNAVTITSFPPGSGIGIVFNVPTLLDEFGQSFNLPNSFGGIPLPDVSHNFNEGQETVAAAAGPLNDGVRLEPSVVGFLIRELSPQTPIDLVIYFNNPDPAQPEQSTVRVNPFTGGPFPPSTTGVPTGAFPGVEGSDYLRFSNLVAGDTTIGTPPLLGLNIAVPFDVANIAAIQVRGEFVRTPEPGSLPLARLALSGVCYARRRRHDLVLCHRQIFGCKLLE